MFESKVLVTGASGFIGSALTKKLFDQGSAVRVLVRNRQKFSSVLGNGAEVIEGDIADPESVRQATAGVETVFHIAGTFREANLSNQRYFDVNVQGTKNVVEASAACGVRRFVHCSTSGIHGSIKGAPAREDHELVLDEVYERTKAEGEMMAIQMGKERGLEVTALRPAQVYGPGDTRLLKLFKMVNSKVTLWFGPGTAHYHLLYIDDLVNAFILAGKAENVAGQSFLIAGGEMPTLNELMEGIAKAMGKEKLRILRLPAGPFMVLGYFCEKVCIPIGISPPIYRRRVEFFTKNKAYDISKARTMLGFEPKTGMVEGLSRTVKWYRQTGKL
jgi:nucleoside-diphosphate-sugar epimerase